MKLSILVALALFAACQSAGAQQLHKCAGPDGTAVFTDKPCPEAMPKHEPPSERKPAQTALPAPPRTYPPNPAVYAIARDDKRITQLQAAYAVALGRGIGCNIEAKVLIDRVAAWLAHVYPPGQAREVNARLFLATVEFNTRQQLAGKSPDTCAKVMVEFMKIPWP